MHSELQVVCFRLSNTSPTLFASDTTASVAPSLLSLPHLRLACRPLQYAPKTAAAAITLNLEITHRAAASTAVAILLRNIRLSSSHHIRRSSFTVTAEMAVHRSTARFRSSPIRRDDARRCERPCERRAREDEKGSNRPEGKPHTSHISSLIQVLTPLLRTNTSAPSPTSATCRSAPGGTWTHPVNSPSSDSPQTSSTQ